MIYESRFLAGILMIVLPTVMIGEAIRPTWRTHCVRICGAPDTRMLTCGSSRSRCCDGSSAAFRRSGRE